MSMFKWDVVDPGPGEAVLPHQRLPWGKTIGLGAQHVVAMFGATFVFPLVMGLDANLAIMFSRSLHDPLPADRAEPGARATSAPARPSSPRSRRSARSTRATTRPTSRARSWSAASCSPPSACSSTSPAPS